MAYTTRTGTSIEDFWPDDTDTKMYISTECGPVHMGELIELIADKWPGCTMNEIKMSAEYIHTHCLGYDRYDPSDYTNFLVIEKITT